MKKVSAVALAAALAVGATSIGPVSAHHSFSMFDNSVNVLHDAVVYQWAYNNPHALIYVLILNEAGDDVLRNAEGDPQLYTYEGAAPPSLAGRGLSGDSYNAGDRIQIVACPLRDGSPGGAIGRIRVPDPESESGWSDWHNPSDAGCNANAGDWTRWAALGIRTLADGEAYDEANPEPEEDEED